MSSAALRLGALLLTLLVASGLALLGAGQANAGTVLSPAAGAEIEVATDDTGQIESPETIDLVVQLDSEDTLPRVWVSESPEIDQFGTPAEGTIDRCDRNQLLPQGEPGKWVCRIDLRGLDPDTNYYWWLEFRRADPGQSAPTVHTTAPSDFFLFKVAGPEPTEDPVDLPPEPADPHEGVSTKTMASAATLPGANVFTGKRSIKHLKLTQLVYRTMKSLGAPRKLAFACWNAPDWLSVLAAEGDEPTNGNSFLAGFWHGRQPRWLHLSPRVCTDVQALLTSKKPNARRARALSTVIHETLHAYGSRNEAQTNCFAVQMLPYFGLNLGMTVARAEYLGKLGLNAVRAYSPPGYWDSRRCRDGSAWDLFPDFRNL